LLAALCTDNDTQDDNVVTADAIINVHPPQQQQQQRRRDEESINRARISVIITETMALALYAANREEGKKQQILTSTTTASTYSFPGGGGDGGFEEDNKAIHRQVYGRWLSRTKCTFIHSSLLPPSHSSPLSTAYIIITIIIRNISMCKLRRTI